MVSIKNDIININDISIETNNYNNTNIDNINKYIFDLFALFQKYFNEELEIKLTLFYLMENQIHITYLLKLNIYHILINIHLTPSN